MKKGLRFGLVLAGCVAVAAAGYVALVPKIGHASEAEIMAALPASLKVEDAPDPAGEARYTRLKELVKGLDRNSLRPVKPGEAPRGWNVANEATLIGIDRLLNEGGLHVPETKRNAMFPELVDFKDAAKLMGLAAKEARERRDFRTCGHWVILGLRFAKALEHSGGDVINQLVAIAIDAIAVRSAYVAEIDGGLDAWGRGEILALLPPGDGRSPAMASAVRQDFQQDLLPVLLDPKGHEKDLMEFESTPTSDDEPKSDPSLVGTYDPIASARLSGSIYAATMEDLLRPRLAARHDDVRLMEEAGKGLPEPPDDEKAAPGLARAWAGLVYRARMNAGSNTLGRVEACQGVGAQLGSLTAMQAANRNLVRAVILLRSTGKASVSDPFQNGDLKIDQRRKVIWSVGKDGKDDRGAIGRGGDYLSPDLGYPYGDHSFHPNPSGPFRKEPAGMPPPP